MSTAGRDDYREYLLSNKWQKVKDDFKSQNDYEEVCYLCPNTNGLQLHHWRYEKDWSKDNHKNLIQLCDLCHQCVHNTKIIHNSHMYKPNHKHRYLSHLIKELRLMETKHIEFYALQF
mgnify:CR=1 FL=1